ncbi:unnamed protein product [Chrysoparadoxa australica]
MQDEAITRRSTAQRRAAPTYAVYFCTAPLPDAVPDKPAAMGKRLTLAWSLLRCIPGRPGEVLFVQGRSNRLLLAALPGSSSPLAPGLKRTESLKGASMGAGGNVFIDGSRVVMLGGHKALVRCIDVDRRGEFAVSGDDDGVLCVRVLRRSHKRDRYNTIEAVAPADYSCCMAGHKGPAFAAAFVPGKAGCFISGGVGNAVRMWRGEWNSRAGALEVHPLQELEVGGCQVTCLSCTTTQAVVGTLEGVVFSFALPEKEDGTAAAGSLKHKIKHTSLPITQVGCSTRQDMCITSTSSGSLRIYRQLAGKSDDMGNQPAPLLVAECQLGLQPVYGDFFSCDEDACSTSAAAAGWEDKEIFLACSASGMVKVWQTDELPTEPLPPPLPEELERTASKARQESAGLRALGVGAGHGQAGAEDGKAGEECEVARPAPPLPVPPPQHAGHRRRVSFSDQISSVLGEEGDLGSLSSRGDDTLQVKHKPKHLQQTWGRRSEQQASVLPCVKQLEPSLLQKPTMLSSLVLQAEIEREEAERPDLSSVQEAPRDKLAAARVTTIARQVKQYGKLTPVSLDGTKCRQRRHTSKKNKGEVTQEEDIAEGTRVLLQFLASHPELTRWARGLDDAVDDEEGIEALSGMLRDIMPETEMHVN